MKTIWKYTLKSEITISMPEDAQILSVHEQHGEAQLWALVDPDAPKENIFFKCYGTGHKVKDYPGQFIGTFFLNDFGLVFHVFKEEGI